MSSEKERAAAGVLSSFVADSLALGAHWVYDSSVIADKIGKVEKLLKPTLNTYHATKEAGDFTHYGDLTLLLLKHLKQHKSFNQSEFIKEYLQWGETYQGYQDHAFKESMKNLKEGKVPGSESNELAGASRIAPLMYMYRDDLDTMVTTCREQAQLTHGGPLPALSAELFARAAYDIMQSNTPPSEALKKAADVIGDALLSSKVQQGLTGVSPSSNDEEFVVSLGGFKTVGGKEIAFGKSCGSDYALPATVYFVAKYESRGPAGLMEALISNVGVGGDSAARGLAIGLLLGVYFGMQAIPVELFSGLRERKTIETFIDELP
mmetsp:Transcript_7885/g.12626  ORF Transcript_7885/g.12626 Transcript_7885/m.12626 type:complete len:321 (-) Transcript_7885:190-1152(-)